MYLEMMIQRRLAQKLYEETHHTFRQLNHINYLLNIVGLDKEGM